MDSFRSSLDFLNASNNEEKMAVDMKFCSYFVFLVNINRNEKKKEETTIN